MNDLIPMLRKQSKLHKQPNGHLTGIGLLFANAAERIQELESSLALTSQTAEKNSSVKQQNRRLESTLDLYKQAINKIDDSFEYSNESAKDRQTVQKILADLTKKLYQLMGPSQDDGVPSLNTEKLMTQFKDIGVQCCLKVEQIEHIICLLRLIEHLQLNSQLTSESSKEDLERQLKLIHRNHLELAKAASQVLTSIDKD